MCLHYSPVQYNQVESITCLLECNASWRYRCMERPLVQGFLRSQQINAEHPYLLLTPRLKRWRNILHNWPKVWLLANPTTSFALIFGVQIRLISSTVTSIVLFKGNSKRSGVPSIFHKQAIICVNSPHSITDRKHTFSPDHSVCLAWRTLLMAELFFAIAIIFTFYM